MLIAKGLITLYLDRNFYDNGDFAGRDLKDNYARFPFSSHNARIGADFFPSKKTIIGFVVNGNFNDFTRKTDNNATVIDAQEQPFPLLNHRQVMMTISIMYLPILISNTVLTVPAKNLPPTLIMVLSKRFYFI